jgi:RNA 2',3'-cyclic 3'-phosphodiesterase
MPAKRLFVALELPDSVRQSLTALDPGLRGVRWLNPAQMHLTLSFLGPVGPAEEEKLCEGLSAIRWSAFFLPIAGAGVFPGRGRPRIVWIGVGSGHPHLFQLHKRVQEAALAAALEPDLRPWHPHITLARCRDVSPQTLRPFLKANADREIGLIHVESFALFSSRPGPDGSVYTRELLAKSM